MKHITYLLLFTLLCCTPDDQPQEINEPEENAGSPPVISSLSIDINNHFAGDELIINATVNDIDKDIISYDWTVSEGSFEKISNFNIKWKSPEKEDTYTITLKVTDSKNHTTSKSESIELNERPDTFQKIINAHYFRLFSDSRIEEIDGFLYYYSGETGSTQSNGNYFKLKKIDLKGNEIWTKTYATFLGAYTKNIDVMFKTSDGNLILGTYDEIIKVNTEGEILWTYSDPNIRKFIELDNGNYLFLSSITYDNWIWHTMLVTLTPDGVEVEKKIIELEKIRSSVDIAKGTEPNSYFILSWVSNPDSPENISEILHINSAGEITDIIGFPYNSRGNGRLFREENGTYTAFFSTEFGFEKKINKVNFDTSGSQIDDISYSFEKNNNIRHVEKLSTGGYLIAGAFGNSTGSSRSLMFKINEDGDVSWQKEFGKNSNLMDFSSCIIELEDGKIMVSGSTFNSDVSVFRVQAYLHKYNSDGSL
jgi:hypothetical protein